MAGLFLLAADEFCCWSCCCCCCWPEWPLAEGAPPPAPPLLSRPSPPPPAKERHRKYQVVTVDTYIKNTSKKSGVSFNTFHSQLFLLPMRFLSMNPFVRIMKLQYRRLFMILLFRAPSRAVPRAHSHSLPQRNNNQTRTESHFAPALSRPFLRR